MVNIQIYFFMANNNHILWSDIRENQILWKCDVANQSVEKLGPISFKMEETDATV